MGLVKRTDKTNKKLRNRFGKRDLHQLYGLRKINTDPENIARLFLI